MIRSGGLRPFLARLRCWLGERRLAAPEDRERLDRGFRVPQEVARNLISDYPDRPLWVEFRRRYGTGEPGITRETDEDWIFRTAHGCIAGGARVYLMDDPEFAVSIDVAVDPRYRRRGYATALYEAIAAYGINVEMGSDISIAQKTMTAMGYAFMVGRRAKRDQARLPPGIRS